MVQTVAGLGMAGPIGLITAGWRDHEGDPSLIHPQLADRTVHLPLYASAERVWRDDPDLAEGHHAMQRAVRTVRRAYNVRLAHAMNALAAVGSVEGEDWVVASEEAAAFDAVRRLDEHQVSRVAALRSDYEERFQPQTRDAVKREREELARTADSLEAVVIEGGHVAALLNRLRLFDMASMLAGKTVVGCSGGAMVLADRLVLFHDSPPQGPGHAEVAERGLGLIPDIVPLPHADRRLRLDDPKRVSVLARRLEPALCVVVDVNTRLVREGHGWSSGGGRRLTVEGTVVDWSVAS